MKFKNNNTAFVSILIPAYNEEKRICTTIEKVNNYFKSKNISYEIIVVDDGSKDNTLMVVKNFLEDSNPKINNNILHFDENRGKGFAIKKGMLSAKGEYVLFIDADCAAPIEEFDKFLNYFDGNNDILIGSRKTRNGLNVVKAPLYRKFFGHGYAKFASIFLGLEITDTTCGFKCFRHTTIEPIFSRQRLHGWSFDAEILFLARKLGFTIKEIPINWEHEEMGSKVNVMRDIFKSGWELIKIRINDLRGFYS